MAWPRLVVGHAEGPGADRGQAVLRAAQLFQAAAADDGHGPAAGALQRLDEKRCLRRLERHLDLVVAQLLDVGDVGDDPAVDRLVRILRALVGEDHVVGGEGVAVVEGDALAQVEGPLGAVVVGRPVDGEVALGHQLGVDVGQAAQDVGGDLEQQHLVDLGRIQGPELADAGPAGPQGAARMPRPPADIPAPGRRWAAVIRPEAASRRRTVRRSSCGPARSWRCRPNIGSLGSKSWACENSSTAASRAAGSRS